MIIDLHMQDIKFLEKFYKKTGEKYLWPKLSTKFLRLDKGIIHKQKKMSKLLDFIKINFFFLICKSPC